MKKILLLFIWVAGAAPSAFCQDVNELIARLKARLEQVNSYEADAVMKTNVSYLKVPDAAVKIYYRKPDKLKIKNEKGISLVPKGMIGITLNNLLRGNFTAIDAGRDQLNGRPVRIIKLLPTDDNAEVVLSTIYVDESAILILKAKTTTRESGTYELNLVYGKYARFALPDMLTCSFNAKDYKLPKGITFDYDDGTKKPREKLSDNTQGKVEIRYSAYSVNIPIPDSVFQ